MRSSVDDDLAEISARCSAAKNLNPMQKAMAAERIVLVMARALERLARRVDELADKYE